MNEQVKWQVEHLKEQERLKVAENSAVIEDAVNTAEFIADDIFAAHEHETEKRSHHKKVKK